jgi:hypothetical protein
MRRQSEVILQHETSGCYRILIAHGTARADWTADPPQRREGSKLHEVLVNLGDFVPLWRFAVELLLARGGATIQPPEESCLVNLRSLHG